MDVGIRHEIPGSEAEGFLPYSNSHSHRIKICTNSLKPNFPTLMQRGPDDNLQAQWTALQERKSEFESLGFL